jgi:hypothetical protein
VFGLLARGWRVDVLEVLEYLREESDFAEGVGLVDHDPLEVAEEQLLALKETGESLVRAYQNVHAVFDDFRLFSETLAQIQTIDLHLTMVTDALANVSGLQRQFLIESDHQSPGPKRVSQDPALIYLLLFEVISNREHVSKSFATAGRRGDMMRLVVLGLERGKQTVLDVSGSVDVIGLEVLGDSLVEGEMTERRQSQTGFGPARK